jgi:pimeloyl-ACP methyl ester carboxylesterase
MAIASRLLTLAGFLLGLVLLGLASMIRPDIPVERLIPAYADSSSRFIGIDGMQVHVREEGSGPAVLLIHGTFSSMHTWDAWTDALTDSYRVIRLDLPGFGLTGPNPAGDYSIRATLHVIDSIRVVLGIQRWSLAGNSLGGRIALEYGRHHPARTDALILVDAAAAFPQDTSARSTPTPSTGDRPLILQALANPVVREAMSLLTPRFLFENALAGAYGDPSRMKETDITRYYELMRREGNRSAFITRASGTRIDRGNLSVLPEPVALADLRMPVLIQWGAKDTWIPLRIGERIQAAIPGSQLIVYPDAGHAPMEEIPAESVADARTFLTKTTQP